MDKKQMLRDCLNEYQAMLENDSCMAISLIRYDGTRSGICNDAEKKLVLKTLIQEYKRQLNELKY